MFYPWNGCFPLWETFKVIPTVYEQAMSYEEQILCIANAITEVLKQLDNDNSAFYEYVNQQISNANDYTDNATATLSLQLSNLVKLMQDTDKENRTWTLLQLSSLYNKIAENGSNVWVTNPFTGGVDTIQNVLDNMARVFGHGITAGEYSVLQVTAEDYKEKEITAFDYDFHGRKYWLVNPKGKMFNPWTGNLTSIRRVLNLLIDLHKVNAITTEEYQNSGITTTEYQEMSINAYEYDWNGKTLFVE